VKDSGCRRSIWTVRGGSPCHSDEKAENQRVQLQGKSAYRWNEIPQVSGDGPTDWQQRHLQHRPRKRGNHITGILADSTVRFMASALVAFDGWHPRVKDRVALVQLLLLTNAREVEEIKARRLIQKVPRT